MLPLAGRVALFLSAEVAHEVAPAFAERHAVTLWCARAGGRGAGGEGGEGRAQGEQCSGVRCIWTRVELLSLSHVCASPGTSTLGSTRRRSRQPRRVRPEGSVTPPPWCSAGRLPKQGSAPVHLLPNKARETPCECHILAVCRTDGPHRHCRAPAHGPLPKPLPLACYATFWQTRLRGARPRLRRVRRLRSYSCCAAMLYAAALPGLTCLAWLLCRLQGAGRARSQSGARSTGAEGGGVGLRLRLQPGWLHVESSAPSLTIALGDVAQELLAAVLGLASGQAAVEALRVRGRSVVRACSGLRLLERAPPRVHGHGCARTPPPRRH